MAEDKRITAWVVKAHVAESEALWNLLEYRPRDLGEVARRADHLLRDGSWFEVHPSADEVEALVRSMATLEVA